MHSQMSSGATDRLVWNASADPAHINVQNGRTTPKSEPVSQVVVNARVSQLCPEDKNKIGGLIRRLVDMKEKHEDETRQAEEERLRLDHELAIAHEQNLAMLTHTKGRTVRRGNMCFC